MLFTPKLYVEAHYNRFLYTQVPLVVRQAFADLRAETLAVFPAPAGGESGPTIGISQLM
jgi:hypothetical protein